MELGDISEMIVDCEHRTAPTQEAGYPSIRTPNIGRGYFILDNVNRVSDETYILWTRRAVPKAGDLIMAREAPVGNVAMIPDGLQPCLGQRTVLIRSDTSKVIPRYLVYLLIGPEVQATIHSLTNGVTVPHLNMKDIRTLPLPELPSLPTQRKIAAILSAYDDLIENNTRRIQILEEMAQTLYRHWFVDFQFPGHENVRMVDSGTDLGLVPEGWEVRKLGEIAKVNTESIGKGNAPERINYVDISSVSTGQIDEIRPLSFADAPSRARRKVKHGDVIYATVRPNRKSFSLIIEPIPNLIVSTGFAVVTAIEVPYTYLYYAMITDEFVGYLTNRAQGAAYPAVNTDDFTEADFLIPQKDLLEKYNENVQDIVELKHILLSKNANLRATRDLLLPHLVSGELDVSELHIPITGC